MAGRPQRIAAMIARACVLALAIALPGAGVAEAATFEVTRTDDPSPGLCTAGDCSLREAVNAADATPAADTVVLAAKRYELSLGELEPTFADSALTLSGKGAAKTTIDANGLSAVIAVADNGIRLTISRMTLTGGNTPSSGGAISGLSETTLEVVESAIVGNVSGNSGGAIQLNAEANLTVLRSSISGNSAPGAGGAIQLNSDSRSSIIDSTISGNRSLGGPGGGRGGAIQFNTPSNTVMTNTTISGNSALQGTLVSGAGGGLAWNSPMEAVLTNVTITGNSAGGPGGTGGAIQADLPSDGIVIENSIVADNSAALSDNCDHALTSDGFNLEDTNSCGFGAAGDLPNENPLLGPLASNGGLTLTHALKKKSPAVNAIPRRRTPGKDQRGVKRKGKGDIGAYERAKCGGVLVNVVGTGRKDKLKGSKRKDGILGLGGNDKLTGKGKRDGLCGGRGKDKLKGGAGDDTLAGNQGTDRCDGGDGADKARSCEVESGIP
jgi:CSLREA domain-containing protein